MTAFDGIAGTLLTVSGLIGLARGATREITTVAAFVLSAIFSVFALRFSGPLARRVVHTDWLASAAAILVVFVLTYIVLRLIGGALTEGVRQTGLSGLDRLLGLGVGLVRAVVVLGGFALLLKAATPPERMPGWITTAALYPLASAAGEALRAFAPRGARLAHRVAPALATAVEGDPLTSRPRHRANGHHGGDGGYTNRQADAMDDLVEDSR